MTSILKEEKSTEDGEEGNDQLETMGKGDFD